MDIEHEDVVRSWESRLATGTLLGVGQTGAAVKRLRLVDKYMTEREGGSPTHNQLLPVCLAHVPGRIHPKVLAEIRRQGYSPRYVETPTDDDYSEQSAMRRIWREGTGFIWLEQSALPPPHAIDEYQRCKSDYCTRPHNCRTDGFIGAWACFKISRRLVVRFPDLADRVLAKRDSVVWWQQGLLVNRPWRPEAAIPGGLRTACVDPAAVANWGPWPGPEWPTTRARPAGDVELHQAIARRGVEPCVHEAPSTCYPHTTDTEASTAGFRWYADTVNQVTR